MNRNVTEMKIIGSLGKRIVLLACRLLGGTKRVFCGAILAVAILPVAYGADCSKTSVGLTPINDLGSGTYLGFQGGLYPGGSNQRPASHESAVLALARSIGPMNANGGADPNGKYVLLAIGMSNANQEFEVFLPDANADRAKDTDLVIVNGAQGGATALDWGNASSPVWSVAMEKLADDGVTADQVAVVWAKLANSASRDDPDPYREGLQIDVESTIANLKGKFPNLKLAYLTSRIYAGYASSTLNPEPYAYESGFVMKWTIEKQLNGEIADAPWLSWGPYPWADGLKPRSDGLVWECGDLREDDGTHPSDAGMRKVANMLLTFFKTDTTAREWFLANPGDPADTIAPGPPQNLTVVP